jgi:hypothetical protein
LGIKKILESDLAGDVILATGITSSIREIVNQTCLRLELKSTIYVPRNETRLIDFPFISIGKQESWHQLNWCPNFKGADTLHSIVQEFISTEHQIS